MRIRSHSAIACTATEFIVEADLQAFEGDLRIFSRSWTERHPARSRVSTDAKHELR